MNENFIELLQPLDKVEEEVYIQEIMNMGYTKEEAINILSKDNNSKESNFPWLCF